MSIFKTYEKKVIYLLATSVLSPGQLETLVSEGEFVGYEYTGSGYFLSVRHASLPGVRMMCDRPLVMGKADGIVCGFVIFIEDGRLTIECHSWGELEVPEDYRDRDVQVAAI
jgi:hypothetical protein